MVSSDPHPARDSLEAMLSSLLRPPASYTCLVAAVEGPAGFSFRWSWQPPADEHRAAGYRFDLASLTKPFTATLALRLDHCGTLPLDAPLLDLLPELAGGAAVGTRLAELLTHRARLVPWLPLYSLCRRSEEVPQFLRDPRYWSARRGTYSDLGFILWGMAAERAAGCPLDELLRREVLTPLRTRGATFAPGPAPDVADCGIDTGKEVELGARLQRPTALLPAPERGQPQDGNARFLGGVAGHAGLFASIEDLLLLGSEWLAPGRVLSRAQVERALNLDRPGRFGLGWMRRTLSGSAGSAVGKSSFGYTGFVGGSLWLDPEAGLQLALLGHRSDPFSELNAIRRRFHLLAVRMTRGSAGG